jgi:hypothetical protein
VIRLDRIRCGDLFGEVTWPPTVSGGQIQGMNKIFFKGAKDAVFGIRLSLIGPA